MPRRIDIPEKKTKKVKPKSSAPLVLSAKGKKQYAANGGQLPRVKVRKTKLAGATPIGSGAKQLRRHQNVPEGRRVIHGGRMVPVNQKTMGSGNHVLGDILHRALKISKGASDALTRQLIFSGGANSTMPNLASTNQPNRVKVSTSGIDIKPSKKVEKLGAIGKEPVLTILENVNRPGYAVGNSANQIAENIKKGKSWHLAVGKAAERGITLKQKRGSGQALHTLGVPKGIAAPAGFVGDVLTDPTTYVSLGAGSLARKGAIEASQAATTRVVKKVAKKVEKDVVAGRSQTAGKIAKAEKSAAAKARTVVENRPESSSIQQQRSQLQALEAAGKGGSAKAERIRRNLANAGRGRAKQVRKIEARPERRAAVVGKQEAPSKSLGRLAGDRVFHQTSLRRVESGAARAPGKRYTTAPHGYMGTRTGGSAHVGFVTPRVPFTKIGGKRHALRWNFDNELKLAPTKAATSARKSVNAVRPTVRLSGGSDPNQVEQAIRISNESLAIEQNIYAKAQRQIDALARSLPEDLHAPFMDAIEKKGVAPALNSLPPEFRPLVKHVEDSLKHDLRQAQRHGYAVRPIRPIKTKPLKENLARVQTQHQATNRLRTVNRRLASIDRKILTAKAKGNAARVKSLQKSKRGLVSVKQRLESSGLVTRPTTNRHVTKARQQLDRAQALRKAQATGYFPHMRESTISGQHATSEEEIQARIDAMFGHPTGGGSNTGGKLTTTKRRRVVAPATTQNQILEGEQKYSTDVPLVWGNASVQSGRMQGKGHRLIELAKLGREVKPVDIRYRNVEGRTVRVAGPANPKVASRRIPSNLHVSQNEAVYYIGQENRTPVIHELTPEQIRDAQRGYATRASDDGSRRIKVPAEYPRKSGKLVVLDKEAVGKFHELYGRPPKDTGLRGKSHEVGASVDKIMRGWKALATGTPGFHIRNTVSDTQMALNDVPPSSLIRLAREAVVNTAWIRARRKNLLAGGEVPGSKDVIDLGKSGKVTRKEWNRELEKNGIITGGVVGGELRNTAASGEYGIARSTGFAKTRRSVLNKTHLAGKGRALRDALQDRENLMRQAVYKHFREAGLSQREAARKTDGMVNYVMTTRFERSTAKRAMPFYTFSARAIPKHTQTLLSRPGKAASYEKLRNEVAFGTGQQDNLDKEQTFKQALAGVPIPGGYVSAGLANASSLNQLPVNLLTGHPKQELARQLRFAGSMLAPPLRWPIEFGPTLVGGSGYNLFFRGPIKPQYGDLVPAPRWAKDLPPSLKKNLNVMEYTDKKTGKKIVGWSGQASYVLSQLPGLPQAPIQLSQDINRRGQTGLGKALGFFGVKVDTKDPHAARLEAAFRQYQAVETEKARLIKANKMDTPHGKAVAKWDKALKGFIQRESKRAGYKTPLFQPKKKVKKKTDPFSKYEKGSGDPWKKYQKSKGDPWSKYQ